MIKHNKVISVDLDKIWINIKVRITIEEERVLQFAMLYESKGADALPPLEVTKDFELVDGRTRYEGISLARNPVDDKSFTHVNCVIVEFDNEAEKLIYASKANMGGSKPPSNGDIEMVFQMLLEGGKSRKFIIKEYSEIIGSKTVVQRLDWIESKMAKQRKSAAADEVKYKGATLPDAAAKYNVNLKALQDFMSNTKKDTKKASNDVECMRTLFKRKHFAVASTATKQFKQLLKKFEDGLISVTEVNDFLKYQEDLFNDDMVKVQQNRQVVNQLNHLKP